MKHRSAWHDPRGGYDDDNQKPQGAEAFVIHLTPRQTTIRDMLVEGMTAKEIGARLGISHRTVESLGKTVRDKYGVKDRIQLVRTVMKGKNHG